MIGARQGRSTWLRRLAARAAARTLTAFVVPGPEVARARGLDLEGAGLRPVATPRHADVLALVGDIPPKLAEAAAVAYVQMPRPRAILSLGAGTRDPLPAPDVEVGADADQAALRHGVDRLHRLLIDHTWARDVAPFDVQAVRPRDDNQPGGMDQSGMHSGAYPGMNHGSGDHAQHGDQTPGDGSGEHRGSAEGGTGRDAGDDSDEDAHPQAAGHSRPEMASEAHGDHEDTGVDAQRRPDERGKAKADSEATQHGDKVGLDHMDHEENGDGAEQHHGQASAEHSDQNVDHTGSAGGSHRDLRSDDDAHAAHDHQGHGGHEQEAPARGAAGHQRHQHMATRELSGEGRPDQGEMRHDGHAAHDHSGHGGETEAADGDLQHGDHSGMSHGLHMGGFMSMVEMTRDLPRSADGLPMEWIEAPFGPLFPGLPGGLALTLTLDGDTVARAKLAHGIVVRSPDYSWPRLAADLPDHLAALDPLSPVAYRLLAVRALESVAGTIPDDTTALGRTGALERERAASHLNWLAGLGHLLGDVQLAQAATALQLAVLRAPHASALVGLRPRAASLARLVRRQPLLARRLRGVGCLTAQVAATLRGPTARAMGIGRDLRADDPAYRALGFAPVLQQGGDALARLEMRLAEIEQSLDLVAAAGTIGPVESVVDMPAEGDGAASIETPRGGATLRLSARGGDVHRVVLDTPSAAHADLVPAVAAGRELADALVAVASLDLSPWEIDR